MSPQTWLVVLPACFFVSEAVSISKGVPQFVTDHIANTAATTTNGILGEAGGKRWAHSRSDGKELETAAWHGNNWEKRNIFTGVGTHQKEDAQGLYSQGGKVKEDGGNKVAAKQVYTMNRKYSKKRNEAKVLASPMSGKSIGAESVYTGKEWVDADTDIINTNKEMTGSSSADVELDAYANNTNYLHKRGRLHDLNHVGKITGGGSGSKFVSKGGALSAASQTAAGANAAEMDGDGTNFKSAEVTALAIVAQDPEPSELVNKGLAPTGDGRQFRTSSTIGDTSWTDSLKARISHTEWIKWLYFQGPDCAAGVWEGTDGCRYKCVTGDNCDEVYNSCHATDNPGAGGDTAPCNAGCYGSDVQNQLTVCPDPRLSTAR